MICWQIEKTFCKAKIPPGEFKITISKNPLINNQVATSIRNFTTTLAHPKIPTYNWTFTSIPNWTWSCSSFLSFDAQISNLWLTPLHGSRYVTNSSNLNDCVGCKVLHFVNNKDQKALCYKILWRTNTVTSHREN